MSVVSVTTSQAQKQAQDKFTYIADRWLQIPREYAEIPLGTDLLLPILDQLGIAIEQRKQQTAIHKPGKSVLRPDFLVYRDIEEPPVLVIEIKKRISIIYDIPESEFDVQCKEQYLYRAAIGYEETKENGVRQYLNPETVRPEFLAPYGLVFNGDFFQLWRRVDGLIFPITPIEKFTDVSLPRLLHQLQLCLELMPPALIAAVWNRKGGVAKTTNAINIAATLALAPQESPRRVLLIDLDPQGDLAHGIGLDHASDDQIIQSLFDKLELKEADKAKELLAEIIKSKKFPTSDKNSFELSLFSINRKKLEQFRDSNERNPVQIFLSIINLIKLDYDYVFIDAAPVLDPLL